jgi:hypothetical protein
VPTSAVLDRDGTSYVQVSVRGQLEERVVKVLRRGRERVAIETGVVAGEQVAVTTTTASEGPR